MLAEEAIAMSTKKCRLCAKSDEDGIVVEGEENITKILPTRMQTYLDLDIFPKIVKAIRLCPECLTALKSFQQFFDKIQNAQIVWSDPLYESPDYKEKSTIPKPKRREAKLVPFLIRGLDSGRFRGLEWENRSQGLFRLPWPRQGTNKWRPEDSQLFKEWAVLKGRYSDKEDFVLWKTCIRTSLHKLPNVTEVREYHNFLANPPYKVYCITDFAERYNLATIQVNMDHNYSLNCYSMSNKREQGIADTEDSNGVDLDNFVSGSESGIKSQNCVITPLPVESNDWCVAREETVSAEDQKNRSQKINKNRQSLNELPNEETVARWIQDFKWKFSQQQAQAQERLSAALKQESEEENDVPTESGNVSDGVDLPADAGVVGASTSSSTSNRQSTVNQRVRRSYDRNCKGRICPLCGEKFDNMNELVKHRQEHRLVGKRKMASTTSLSCSVCDKKLSNNEELKNHLNTHFGIRPYTCNLCTSDFYSVGELNIHKKSHLKRRKVK